VTTWDRLADLELRIDGYALEPLRMNVSSGFERLSTVIRLRGAGLEGIGEDVTYEASDQEAAWEAGPNLPLAGTYTFATFADHVAGLDLFDGRTPDNPVYRRYRRWAYESAALDLALNQAGLALHEAVGREPQPLNFVVSLRLGEPASMEPLAQRLATYPSLRFKLDPTPTWTDEIIAGLVATGAVDSVDFKGHYTGAVVDVGADPDLYRRVIDAFPDAWYEDPRLTPEIDELLKPHRDRITWDAPIHSIADIEALPFLPRMVNVKPSRFGSVQELMDVYDWLAARDIGAYGGGQFELGPGRGQIQLLACIFHASTPNDVSPTGFHVDVPPAGLPTSPMPARPTPTGMRWAQD
jgi:L-alanine-DL-glutamate epimerase-like enolase superfamily enzyme